MINPLPDRLQRLAKTLEELSVDAMLVSDETNVRYLSGFTGDSSYLWVEPGAATILSDGRYQTQIACQCPGLAMAIRPPGQTLGELTTNLIADSAAKRVALEAGHVTLSLYRYLDQQCQGIRWVESSGVVERFRMVKSAEEIETTRRAVRIAEAAFESLLPLLNGGWTERAIAHELEAKMRFLGAEGVSFAPIVAVDESAALPHYRPTDRSLSQATTLLIDWGARYDGYASDITRTLHRSHASEAFRRAYQAVLEAQMAAIEAIRPGVAASAVDAAARNVLHQHGLADAFKHGLGHGTGLQIHEFPRLSSVSDETLAAGMIVTVEPGVYFEGQFGIRIEDDVLVTETGSEVLSCLPKGLEESQWLL